MMKKILSVLIIFVLFTTTATTATATPSLIKGDLNNDGKVDIIDLGILLSSWGRTDRPPADINQDGRVDIIDLGILLSNWGRTDGSPADLDVVYIERTPRYNRYCVNYVNDIPQLCSGTENQKRWPDAGETVTYIAHVINKGSTSAEVGYQWLVNGLIVNSGNYGLLDPSKEATISYMTTWPSSPKTIKFRADPNNVILESVETNNELTIGSHDLTISIWVERGLYNIFNSNKNIVGSYSFEDWIQAQFVKMNERFSQAKYPATPNGIRDRVRIDKIVVADELDGPASPLNFDTHQYLIDGRWQFTDGDPTNAKGQGGEWQKYVDTYISTIDWGLVHELAHQLGVIDLYRLNVANDPDNNCRVEVRDLSGNLLDGCGGIHRPPTGGKQLPPPFPNAGLMGGGDTSPYNDGTYFESHTAGGMNSNYNKRRGYYGEYLFDVPANNYLKILDVSGNPLVGAQVALYQKRANDEYFDNIPEITGTTNGTGIIFLPNRPVNGVTTATGHTLRDNPFGQINVVGTNGVMLVKITYGIQESYHWLFITDFNLVYWSGNTNSATYIISTTITP